MQELNAFLDGKKTYITAGAMLIYAVAGWYLKYLSPQDAVNTVWAALGMVGFRSALNKIGA